jgi:hypothetical protein
MFMRLLVAFVVSYLAVMLVTPTGDPLVIFLLWAAALTLLLSVRPARRRLTAWIAGTGRSGAR